MDIRIKNYEEFADEQKKYDGSFKCCVNGCNNPAYYEGGDARCYCGMCEEHIDMKGHYRRYLLGIERHIHLRRMWDKDDLTLTPLLEEVTIRLREANA